MRNKTFINKIKRLHSQGLLDGEIAQALGVSRDVINYWRRKLGLKPNHIKIDKKKVKELYLKGLSDREIAKRLNCNKSSIQYIRKVLNLKPNYEYCKLSDEQVKVIKDLNQAGFNDREIADILNIHPNTVNRYRRKMGLEAVGYTCCSLANRVKDPLLKKRIEMCGEATQEFLRRYFGKRQVIVKSSQ